MIKLTCKKCHYSYNVSEAELEYNAEYHKRCLLCQGEIEIDLEDYVATEIEKKVKNNVDRYFKVLGIERAIEIIQGHKNYAIYRLYEAELKKRGLIK